jgi:hypothetical protein
VAGLSILALWAEGLLPARFALPAGIGDVLIGLSAPLVAMYLVGGGGGRAAATPGWPSRSASPATAGWSRCHDCR